MGVAVGDYDHDGLMDIFVTTFAMDNYVLFHNDGKASSATSHFRRVWENLQFPIWAGEHSS